MHKYLSFHFDLFPPTFKYWGCWVPWSKEDFFDLFLFFLFLPNCWGFLDCVDYTKFTSKVWSRIGKYLEFGVEGLGLLAIVN